VLTPLFVIPQNWWLIDGGYLVVNNENEGRCYQRCRKNKKVNNLNEKIIEPAESSQNNE
jgi:hypothetical protein